MKKTNPYISKKYEKSFSSIKQTLEEKKMLKKENKLQNVNDSLQGDIST